MTTPAQRFARVRHGERVVHGRLEGTALGEVLHVYAAAPWLGGAPTGETLPMDQATLLAPVVPGKLLAIGRNYRSHLGDRAEPSEPGVFVKLANALANPGDEIPIPTMPAGDGSPLKIDTEGEMVVVIGKTVRNISAREAPDAVFGLTCGHDISVRNWQRGDLQWTRAKSSDRFAPLGPVVVTGLAYDNLLLETQVNGETLQSERTDKLIFPVDDVIAYISKFMTLEPGDVIMTGTPGTAPAIAPGDTISVTVEGIGTLTNPVIADPHSA